MRIFDCFMYYDEDLILDIRLNTLKKYVDYFVICESNFYHNGEKRDLNFNINSKNYNQIENLHQFILLTMVDLMIYMK